MISARRLLALLIAAVGAACSDGVAPDGADGVPVLFSLHTPVTVSQAENAALSSAFALVNTYQVTVRDSLTGATLVDATLTVTAGGSTHALDVSMPASTVGLPVRLTVVGRNGSQELYRTSAHLRVQDASSSTPVALGVRYTGPGIRGTVTSSAGGVLANVDIDLMQGNSLIEAVTTEPDGTYLFVGKPAGLYQVVPTPPVGQQFCPSVENVNLVTTATAYVADFAANASSCKVDLLIVSGGDLAFANDTATVKALFASDTTINTSAFFFVNNTPGLSMLSQFDVVLLFANGLFNQSPALGSQIEDYVQLGGNVITATFYWQNRSDSGLGSPGWGELEALDPFITGAGQTYQAATLNPNATVTHPLTTGLQSLSSTGFRGAVTAKTGTTVVASWGDGSPLIGYRILPWGSRMVAVGLFPASGNAAGGDVVTLWRNAVRWTGEAGGPTP